LPGGDWTSIASEKALKGDSVSHTVALCPGERIAKSGRVQKSFKLNKEKCVAHIVIKYRSNGEE